MSTVSLSRLADRVFNNDYPEKGEGWGVDDGSDIIRNTYSNGVVERHNHIAYYIHEGLYGINGVQGLIPRALNSLSLAYVYTGEARYGRTGAILLIAWLIFIPILTGACGRITTAYISR